MTDDEINGIIAWVIERGLVGASEIELLHEFCERSVAAGLALSSAMAVIDTLHPIWEGRAFLWSSDGTERESAVEYGSLSVGENAERWERSAFYHKLNRTAPLRLWLMTTGGDEVRRRIGKGDPTDFYLLDGLKSEGHTDYVALVHRFVSDGVIGEMDCVYSHWTTRKADGFSEEDCAALRRLVPALALASKSASLARIAGTLVEVYLGRDAGEHVLRGRMSRGVAERIHAVLWFSDLRGFTSIADSSDPAEIIPLLNECRAALSAEADLRRRIHELNERRRSESRPISSVRLGLHLGDVLFGNIGSDTRLDFTVVGPAVNEVNRIVAMCRSVDRDVLASADFVAALPAPERARFVSVGRFALRGVRRAQELFTLDPDRPSAGGPRAGTNRR
jgi:adenylate cyclase